ncbi:hypothetical protein ACOMHN_008304 [Nucella lapillus]
MSLWPLYTTTSLYVAFSRSPETSEEMVAAMLARAVSLNVLVVKMLRHARPIYVTPAERTMYRIQIYTTMFSLQASAVGDVCLVNDYFVPGMILLGLARVITMMGRCFWLKAWIANVSGQNPSFFSVVGRLALWTFQAGKGLVSAVMNGRGLQFVLRMGIFPLGLVLVMWRAQKCWITLLYSLLLLGGAQLQTVCFNQCYNSGTRWGVVSGRVLVLSHLSVIVAGSRPMSGMWCAFFYYLSQVAYIHSAMGASTRPSWWIRLPYRRRMGTP